jgi:Domain of unknown function (DUF4412)
MCRAILTGTLLVCIALTAKADYLVKEEIQRSGRAQQISVKIKGTKIRVDMAETNSVILDSATGEMTILFHPQKSYLRISADTVKAQVKALKALLGQKSDDAAPAELKPTGNHQQIDGYDTEEYTTEFDGIPMTFFVAKSYPNYQKVLAALSQLQSSPILGDARGLVIPPDKLPGLPLRTIQSFNGEQIVTSIDSVQETDLPDSEFTISDDYKQLAPPADAKKDVQTDKLPK